MVSVNTQPQQQLNKLKDSKKVKMINNIDYKQKKFIYCCLYYLQMKGSQQSCKGFLISCDKNRQKQALRDAYNFITEFIEQIYSDVTEQHIHKKIKDDGKQITLQTQVAYNKKSNSKLLTQIETHVNCICFIKINPIFQQIDPLKVVSQIMKEVHQEGRQITRFCHRILPVQRAFRAEHFRMLDQLDELLTIHSQDKEIRSWMLNFKCRNNTKFNYKQVLKETQKLAKKYGHFPDIYYPQWTITVQISHHLMCLSISQNFKETNQYKLHKKIDKLKYTKEDDEQLDRLNYQHEKEVEQQQEKLKRQKFAKPNNRKKEQQVVQDKEQKQVQKQAQKLLLVQKIEVKQDQIDLL